MLHAVHPFGQYRLQGVNLDFRYGYCDVRWSWNMVLVYIHTGSSSNFISIGTASSCHMEKFLAKRQKE